MLDVEIRIKRTQWFWGKVTSELSKAVEIYLSELNEMKQKLDTMRFDYERTLFGSEELIRKLQADVDREIEYCNFYTEYQQRILEPNFSKWVFIKKEDVKPEYDWQKPQGEQWVKTNGRVKAIIQFDRSGATVKITLKFEEDCEALKFLPDYDWQKNVPIAHLKNEQSIEAKVNEFKRMAEEILSKHLFPLYEPAKNDIQILKKLLCIEKPLVIE